MAPVLEVAREKYSCPLLIWGLEQGREEEEEEKERERRRGRSGGTGDLREVCYRSKGRRKEGKKE